MNGNPGGDEGNLKSKRRDNAVVITYFLVRLEFL